MKKLYKLLMVVPVIFITGCQEHTKKAEYTQTQTTVPTVSEYDRNVQNFSKTTASDFNKMTKKNIFLYLGRPSCPHCRVFVDTLKTVHETTNMPLYYINTKNYSDDTPLQELIEKYHLKGVPSLLYVDGDNVEVYDNSSNLQEWVNNKLKKY